jgi:hypothetical protein
MNMDIKDIAGMVQLPNLSEHNVHVSERSVI